MTETTRIVLIALGVALAVVVLVPLLVITGVMAGMMGGMMGGGPWLVSLFVLVLLGLAGVLLVIGLGHRQ